jgi:hypothetical protein
VAGKWPRPLASSCSRSAGELPRPQHGACMCLLPPRELELQHTVRYTVRVREPERCRALSASFVRKTLGESERSGGECRLRTISDIVVFSVSAHTSPPGVGVADTTRRRRARRRVLCRGCCVTVVSCSVAPQPPHAPMLSAVMPNGQAAPGAGRCTPHRRGCTTLRDTLPVDPTRASGDRLEVSWTGPEVGTRPTGREHVSGQML